MLAVRVAVERLVIGMLSLPVESTTTPLSQPVYLQIAEKIREGIFQGEFRPGEPLPTESDLADTYGAGRASVREALRALQAEGLVVPGGTAPLRAVVAKTLDRPARNALVNLLRLKQVALSDLNDLRAVLESAAMHRAAALKDISRISEAREALQEMERSDLSVARFDEADVCFHVALVKASGNEAMHLIMLALRDPVADQLLEALVRLDDPNPTLRGLIAEHRGILEAVEQGDGSRAGELVDRHIRGFYSNRNPPIANRF